MPALFPSPPIEGPLGFVTSEDVTVRRPHPSPRKERLRLEAISVLERVSWNRRFGIDVPYLSYSLGFGEWAPWEGFSAFESLPLGTQEIAPPAPPAPPAPQGPLYPRRGLYPRPGLYPRT